MGTITFSLPKALVKSIATSTKIENFVETGTGTGQTSVWAVPYFDNVYTIEIDKNRSAEAFGHDNSKIHFIVGDSKIELPKLIDNLKGKSLFFLDTHSYTVDNKSNNVSCSVIEELNAIAKCDSPIIFINDVYRFMGPQVDLGRAEWPSFEQIFVLCKSLFKSSNITIIDGVIVCVPKELEHLVSTYWLETFEQRRYIADPEPAKRSIFERVVSRSKRMLDKPKKSNVETVAYDIKQSEWFENQCKIFYDSHKWLMDCNFKAIVDVGANVGQFGKKIRQYYPEAHLYSFEPIPLVYKELSENFKSDKNFTGFNAGLGDKEGRMEFYMNEFSDSSSLLPMADLHKENYPFTKNEKVIYVDVKTLDGCIDINKIEKPYLLKLDVQGFEEQVINGGSEIVKNAAMIITESTYKELYKGQSLFDSIYEKLKGFGFQFMGNLDQMNAPFNGEPLQGDAIFVKANKEESKS